MISPVPPQRWLKFSTRQGDPGHTGMLPSSNGLASIRLAVVLSGITVASSILCSPSCCKEEALLKFAHPSPFWGPAEECSLFAQHAELQAGGGQYGTMAFGTAELKCMNWVFFMASVLNFIIQQLRSGTNLSTCIAGEERLCYENTGTSEYKIMPPLPSQHYSHLQLKANVYLLCSVI